MESYGENIKYTNKNKNKNKPIKPKNIIICV
jgi:hypothetical protein